jgi:GTPase Era involved in 16S rRNA processing
MKDVFREYNSIDSETKKIHKSYGSLFNDSHRTKLLIVDTPGFNDSSGKDSQHINLIVDEVIKLKHIHAFLLVFNCNNRWGEATNEMLDVLNKIFPNFWNNVILVLNFWEDNENAKMIRSLQGSVDQEESLEEKVTKKIRIDYGFKGLKIIKLNSISYKLGKVNPEIPEYPE